MTDLAERVKEIGWYHQIELPGGILTPGVNNTTLALSRLAFPETLAGRSVLDVGAWDGFYSFEAAKRGAARVLATDSFVWQGRWKQDGFLLARQALGLDDVVEDKVIDVMDLSPEALGATFDIVLFLGVLYHLKDPLGALERVSSVCKGLLVVETETALNFLPFPAARLWPGRELSDDATNCGQSTSQRWRPYSRATAFGKCVLCTGPPCRAESDVRWVGCGRVGVCGLASEVRES